MGNEASKHEAVEPPPEWDPASNAKKFELVSPMSDLSDPSMFLHRRAAVVNPNDAALQQQGSRKNKSGRAAQEPPARLASEFVGTKKGPGAVRQTPAGDRRRKSKVIATRDNAYKHEPRERDLAPPSSFYFPSAPTKKSEESFNQVMKRNSLSTGARRASKESTKNNSNNNDKAQANKENSQHTTTPLLTKARRKVNQATTCLAGCFEESSNNIQLMRDNVNAPRAQRLSSELGASRGVVLQLDKEKIRRTSKDNVGEAPFDPYKVDPIPAAKPKQTVLQFVDGAQQEINFNPVWRESHDGTYHEMSTTTGGNGRESEPTITTKGSDAPRRVSDLSGSEFLGRPSNSGLRPSEASSKRFSGPPSRVSEDDRLASKENEVPESPDDEARAFNLSRADSSKNVKALVSNLIDMYDRRKSTDEMSASQKQLSSRNLNSAHVDPNGEYTRHSSRTIASARDSMGASAATSHESSYWDAFYKDAQALHHEDRVSYNPRQSSGSDNTHETPVVALFGPKKQQSLLGNIGNSPELAASKSEEEDLFANKSVARNDPPAAHDSPDDERLENSSRVLVKETQFVPEFKKPVTLIRSMKPKQKRVSCPVDLDITPKSSIMGFPAESTTKTAHSFDVFERQPSDEESDAPTMIRKTSIKRDGDQPKVAPPAYSRSSEEFTQLENEISEGGRKSFLDNRISANQVLTQTKLVANLNAPTPTQPTKFGRHEIKAALQETPRASFIEPRGSFGSAFSYKDKDVFTPVTSCTTYPKGSPFRPRLNVPDQTLARAKLDQPSMYTQSFDNRRSSVDMQIRATESAPSVIESHDYRDIAYGCFLQDTPSTLVNKKERSLALSQPSPAASTMSLESPMSTATSPGQPLLSDQAVNNAAFLFSPSYASGNSLLALPGETQGNAMDKAISFKPSERNSLQSTYSITTMGSRSRISARSQQSIRIPVSSNGNILSPRGSNSRMSSRKSSISDATASQKSVRFSEANSIAQSEAGSQNSRRSVTWDFSFQGGAPEDVNIPEIETKVSDLSETVFGRESLESVNSKRNSVESTKSAIRPEAIKEESVSLAASKTESRPSLSSTTGSPASSKTPTEGSGTPEEVVQTWQYCEFTKGVTPMLSRKQLSQATNSPVIRFKAAKNKFVGKQEEKVVPVKKKSLSIGKKKILPGRVHALASQFDKGGPLEPQFTSHIGATNSMDSACATSITAIPSERPMLRTPQIHGYTAKAYPNIFERASYDSNSTHSRSNYFDKPMEKIAPAKSAENTVPAKPAVNNSFMMSATPLIANKKRVEEVSDDASDDSSQRSYGSHGSNDDSTFIQSVATLVQEGREVRYTKPMLVENDAEDDADDRLDEVLDEILQSESAESSAPFRVDENLPCDEAADDFAELLLDNILGQDSSKDESESPSATSPKQSGTDLQLQSIVPLDDEDEESTFANILSVPTFSDESTTMSAVLAEQTTANLRHGAKTVQPHVQQQHRQQQEMPPSQALNLSPLQRTPMQASKWRELASLAQQEDSKRSIFRSSKKSKSKSKKGGDSMKALRKQLSERDANVF